MAKKVTKPSYDKETLGFEPSEYQKKFFDFVINGEGNAIIEAGAGCGKTSTLVAAMKLIPKKQKCKFIAFNKSIADELNNKISTLSNCNASTAHSLGYSMLTRNFDNRPELDEYKYRTYVKKHLGELSTIDSDEVQMTRTQIRDYIDTICVLVNMGRLNLAQTPKEMKAVAAMYDIPYEYDECEVAVKCLQWGKDNLDSIDYTDMIWLPVELGLNPRGLQYDWLLIDECQDMSKLSIELVKKCFKRGTRAVFIGDEKQCQPAGTMITMYDGTTRPIEDLKVGDDIVSYTVRSSCSFKGFHQHNKKFKKSSYISAIEHHTHVGEMVKLTTENNLVTRYTPDHLCYARFNEENIKGKYFLYLMCNEKGMFRIGKTQFYVTAGKAKRGCFGLAARMRCEKCNKGWILAVYDDEKSARLDEYKYSMLYQIPQIIFQQARAAGGKNFKTKAFWEDEDIVRLYEELNQEYNMQERAEALLRHFHRNIKYPFHILNDVRQKHSRTYCAPYYACNLLPNIMDVIMFDPTNITWRNNSKRKNRRDIHSIRGKYVNISNIEYYDTEEEVYSLNVETEHTYVADGIMTHNCIYSFAGASPDAFQTMRDFPNTTKFELPVSYRCAKNIVKLANEYVPTLKAREGAPDGQFVRNCKLASIKDGDMVLARSKAPLFNLYTKLLKKGVNCYLKGKDIGRNLIERIEDINQVKLNPSLDADGVFVRLYDKMFTDRNKLMQSRGLDVYDASLSASIIEQYDMINALLLISNNLKYKKDLINKIDEIFADDGKGVCLSTIHKAKGLEATNVYILCRNSMPSKRATKDWEKRQESNLIYVAYTRAKEKLGFISDKELPPSGGQEDSMKIINDMMICERRICRILNKVPTNYDTNIEVAKFNAQNTPSIEAVETRENTVTYDTNDNDSNVSDSLLSELEAILEKRNVQL